MSQNLFTFRGIDYLDMKTELQELFEVLSYLDNCSMGKTEDFQRSIDHCFLNIQRIRSILDVKYLFPSGI